MTNTKRLLLQQCCEYSIYPPPPTLEKTNNFLGAPACARPLAGSLCPTVRWRRRAATAYGRTALSGRDVATRRHRHAARAAVAGAACSRTYTVDRPLTFVTVV